MKSLRKIHLYLGCFFSPMLILFAGTGAAQMLGIRLGILSDVHVRHYGSLPFMLLSILMGLSVIVTAILGIVMALRMGGDKKRTLICLSLGILVPLGLLLLGGSLEKNARRKPSVNRPGQFQGISNGVSSTLSPAP